MSEGAVTGDRCWSEEGFPSSFLLSDRLLPSHPPPFTWKREDRKKESAEDEREVLIGAELSGMGVKWHPWQMNLE